LWFSWRVFSLARSIIAQGGNMITKATINLNGTTAKIACHPEFAAQRST
jgi:hypothetical protein